MDNIGPSHNRFTFADAISRLIADRVQNDKGQTLVEHSLLIGSISASLTAIRDHPYFMIGAILLLLVVLLFWRPKIFATIILIAVLAAVLFFIYRWVEFGHI